MMEPQMSATSTTQSSGVTPPTVRLRPGRKVLMPMPAATGASTTWRVESSRPLASTGTRAPARSEAKSGVAIGAARVETAVMATLRATSAPAISVTRLLAVPPGHEATRMTPTASGGGSAQSTAMAYPSSGMMVYWQANPRKTCLGFLNTRLKSLSSRVIPMQSIVTANAGVMRSGVIHSSAEGFRYPTMPPAATHKGNKFVRNKSTLETKLSGDLFPLDSGI
mmetsp:Transcript_59603/g.158620  ORF Transcript_59603/g.158620 Transcript_59603/m.158620 type:complete len:223 (+) Transcript_59603:354-1022(+)